MSGISIASGAVKATGSGGCTGGTPEPNPPIHDFPLLVCSDGQVRTEDGRATVKDIARGFSSGGSRWGIATQFGTSEEHVRQALGYSKLAGLLD